MNSETAIAAVWIDSCPGVHGEAMRVALISIALLFTPAVGCTKSERQDRGEVQGTVRLDGELVDGGLIVFRPGRHASGFDAVAKIDKGHYRIPSRQGPSVGTMVVQFCGTRPSGTMIYTEKGLTEEILNVFPNHLRVDTTMRREIVPGVNTFNFDLQSSTPSKEDSDNSVATSIDEDAISDG